MHLINIKTPGQMPPVPGVSFDTREEYYLAWKYQMNVITITTKNMYICEENLPQWGT